MIISNYRDYRHVISKVVQIQCVHSTHRPLRESFGDLTSQLQTLNIVKLGGNKFHFSSKNPQPSSHSAEATKAAWLLFIWFRTHLVALWVKNVVDSCSKPTLGTNHFKMLAACPFWLWHLLSKFTTHLNSSSSTKTIQTLRLVQIIFT